MNNKVGLCVIAVLLSSFTAGCTSIRTRTDLMKDDWRIYPGVQQDVKELGEAFRGELPGPVWQQAVVVPILVLDLPASAVFDTLAAPYDLYRIYAPQTTEQGGRVGQ